MGDPGGIGAECIVKALADPARRRSARFVIYGSAAPMRAAADAAGIEHFWWRAAEGSGLAPARAHDVALIDSGGDRFQAWPTREGGRLSYAWVERAIGDCLSGEAQGIVTGPISKAAWHAGGHKRFPGHTELLADRFKTKRVGMLFESPKLRVILATVHIPLMDVRNALTIGKVFDAIDLGNDACKELGIESPRIAVCGLNPHAGEDGMLGDEETRVIGPAIEHAVRSGIDARGPYPGDTVFNRALGSGTGAGGPGGGFDLVVAMYHDQGLIPVKLIGWDRAVNVSCGLPVPRTSPDHGTAFDIVGTNRADAGSTAAAIDHCVMLARLKAARAST
ncbi:MAG: 4-hydroxythreonine-4-phosphate dehydrogenase PdxA [Planctomycetota bacterium]